ncbi:MAG: hypothetical protein ACKOX6_15905 [Bdellovibrio sp.]
MQSGKFKVDLQGGNVAMSYEIAEGQFVEVKAPVGAVLNPILDQLKVKIQSKEIDLIPGTDMDGTLAIGGIDALKALVNK